MKFSRFRGKDVREMLLSIVIIFVVVAAALTVGIRKGVCILKPKLEAKITEIKEERIKKGEEKIKKEEEIKKEEVDQDSKKSEGNIPESAYEYNGHFYYIYDDAESWNDAKKRCEELGGHLATITTGEEDEAINAYLEAEDYSCVYFGLYMTVEMDEEIWKWITGENVSYTNWTAGEPDSGKDEGCCFGAYCWSNESEWRALSEAYTSSYLCEWDMTIEEREEQTGEGNGQAGEGAGRDYIIADSNERYLERSDLENLSKEELRLARNEIYARYGRLFDDEELQSYFNSKDWYEGSVRPGEFQESILNDYEFQNANIIVEYEREMGYN